jgi:hypothetical protein
MIRPIVYTKWPLSINRVCILTASFATILKIAIGVNFFINNIIMSSLHNTKHAI